MKKNLFAALLIIPFINVKAQSAVSSLSENFDRSCASASGFPIDWNMFTPVPGTIPSGAWTCTPTEGRGPSPGMMCTGTFGTPEAYHLDTSYLITPLLDIDSYAPERLYLRFDIKASSVHLGDTLHVVETKFPDSTFSFGPITDINDSIYPAIGQADSANWVTHQVEISQFEGGGPFYLAFRYRSSTTSGSIWYLDNVNTTTINIRLSVNDISKNELPLKVIGIAMADQITISYTTETAGLYNLEIFDMMGRVVFKDLLNAQTGTFTYNINNLDLPPGMYLLKMRSSNKYGSAKIVVR